MSNNNSEAKVHFTNDGLARIVVMNSREVHENIARVCHETNRAYCETNGDHSQKPWNEAPEWVKESAINGVLAHCRSDLTPEQSHEAWMHHKVSDGWVYGPMKDAERKTHPCLVPYSQLSIEQRAKDHLFRGVVKAFLSAIVEDVSKNGGSIGH